MKKNLLRLQLVFILGFILIGCTEKKERKAEETTMPSNQTINLMESNQITSMDSALASDGGSFIAITQVMEGLYNLDEKDRVVPGVAAKLPTIDTNRLVYEIPLRKDAYWSNGEPVTAKDFVYSWQKSVDPKIDSTMGFLLSDVKNATKIMAGELDKSELGIQAKNDFLLEITLEQPVPYFTSVLTFPTLFPQNQKYAEQQGKTYAVDSEHLIYNGPYRLTKWDGSGDTWRYEKNDTYWNKRQSNVQAINIQVLKDPNVAVNLYQTDKLDRAVLSGEYARQLKKEKEYTTNLDSWVHTIELNQKKDGKPTLFANPSARKAIGLAIDRTHITEQLLDNGSEAIYGLIPKGFVENPVSGEEFREENGAIQKQDPTLATKLWQQALKEAGLETISVELCAMDQGENKEITEYLQSTLQETLPGLTIEIKLLPEKNLLDRKNKKEYEFIMTRQGPDYQDPTTFLTTYASDSDRNPSNYSNGTYDQLLKNAQTESLDLEKRWTTLRKAEQILLEDYGVLPLYQSANAALLRPDIHGMIHHLFGPPNYYGKLQVDE